MNAYPTQNAPVATDPSPEARNDFPGMTSRDRAPREVILHRAYAIWEREGYPNDRQLAHWLEAEAEVLGHDS